MDIILQPDSIDDYHTFLAIKNLPRYEIRGRCASFPDEYAGRLGIKYECNAAAEYQPIQGLFDYQRDITAMAIRKRKYAVFADCGLGKTLMFLEYARHVASELRGGRRILIVSPLMVIPQTIAESRRFYGDNLPIEVVPAARLQEWLVAGGHAGFQLPVRIGITNYEALRPGLTPGHLGCLILDESSTLKSHYGKWGTRAIDLGAGLDWKLACTGTPAPNDRIEYANHAVFLDQTRTVNAFLARYFVNKGQTGERWILKPHALKAFYRDLSHWCIFLNDPATYGWSDNSQSLPPIRLHQHHVELTAEQLRLVGDETGSLFTWKIGGITKRAALSTIAKGWYRGKAVRTNKPTFIRKLVDSWPDESTIIWCIYNAEQKLLRAMFPDAANISGDTLQEERQQLIAEFKEGTRKVLISKPKILGFGLNLHRATRQIFSGLMDSYEGFYQAVKRSNRIGATRPLNVHIPITDIEEPMVANVLRKAKQVQSDTEEQERIFKEMSLCTH